MTILIPQNSSSHEKLVYNIKYKYHYDMCYLLETFLNMIYI